jgi:hypothetical protein
MTVRDPLMGSEPSHEAVLTSTEFRRSLQRDNQCKEGVNTHVDSANPFRLLLGTKCSPFFPYRWFRTGTRVIRTGHALCRPENDQSNRKNSVDKHICARCCVRGAQTSSLYIITLNSMRYDNGMCSNTPHKPVRNGRQR